MILAKASLNYNRSFIVQANVITIINYDHKNFIVQASGPFWFKNDFKKNKILLHKFVHKFIA